MDAAQTGAPVAPAPANGQVHDSKPQDLNVTPQPSVDEASIRREEKVEYRDQDGNLLNEEQVSSLDGKVSFQTRYETRTRIVDAAGNEIADGLAGAEGFAPPHPDADRIPETAVDLPESSFSPATASENDDISKEKSAEKNNGKPKPGSEGNEATK